MKFGRLVTQIALLGGSSCWMALALVAPSQTTPKKKLNFSKDVLPILSDKCFKCHGPDSSSRQAGLRLDVAESAFANRWGKYPIVPGKPEHSLLVTRITSKDDPMPPVKRAKPLTKSEIDILKRWIAEGAQYDRLWSFEPLPSSVPVPKVASAWPRNDLDRFILARLQKEKLTPTREAPRNRLLRRVTLDLTGLPPTEAEIRSFETDMSPNAYERVVDRLLSSPHFGERVAVDWLDAARYSDSYGYQSDLLSPTWPYRDWVVRSFNQNKPYNQFLTEQLAGDLLPQATRDQRLATAFNRLHRQSNEGGSIALEFKTTYADDRVDTFGTAILGLTVGCAKCHDHKFDPITQREYYQLFAYFNSIDEYGLLLSTEIVPSPSMLLPTPTQEAKLAQLKAADDLAKKKLIQEVLNAKPRVEEWISKGVAPANIPDQLALFSLKKEEGGKFPDELGGKATAQRLGSLKVTNGVASFDGDNGLALRGLPGQERSDAFTWSFQLKDDLRTSTPVVLLHRTGGTDVGFCGFDLLLEDGHITARVMRAWPGNAVAVRTNHRIPKGEWTHLAWSWDGSGEASGLKLYVDGELAPTSTIIDSLWKKIHAYGDLGDSGGDWTFAQRFRDAGFKGGHVRDISFFTRAISQIEAQELKYPGTIQVGFKIPADFQSQLAQLYTSAIDPATRKAQADVRVAQEALTNFEEDIYEVEVMKEAPKPIPAYVLARGNYDAPRNAKTLVVRNVPKSLPPLKPNGPNNRLALANWVTSPNHPLTARVATNRFWQMIFGVGLVDTSENFGVQGSRPSHPELLDYLSRKFVNSGWNVKALIREIVLSATYRQDSIHSAKLNAVDPGNRLLARGSSRRLTAEMIRDTALASAGLLNSKLGGTPVNPYQPTGLWRENNAFSPEFVQSKGDDLYRRSLYSTWKRTTPVPSMLLFDTTSREACVMRRPPTNTPLQALVLLNDIQFVEAARVLAEHAMERGSIQDQIRYGFARLSGREPDAYEISTLLKIREVARTQFAQVPTDAAKLIKMGDSKANPKLDPLDLAATTVMMQAILNSDAVIWKR